MTRRYRSIDWPDDLHLWPSIGYHGDRLHREPCRQIWAFFRSRL